MQTELLTYFINMHELIVNPEFVGKVPGSYVNSNIDTQKLFQLSSSTRICKDNREISCVYPLI